MNQQQYLLALIWNDDPTLLAESGLDIRGINIYRKNLLVNAQRALSITFPTIFKLIDSDISENLVQQFIKLCPPVQGDWTQWGKEFSGFIATNKIADKYPYLPDCAQLDWHMHCALHGKDQTLEKTSLQLLADREPENIIIILNHNIKLIKTIYPIFDIFFAHHHPNKQQREIAMRDAKIALSNVLEEQVVMVSRPEFQPKLTTLTHSEAIFMFNLNTGSSLAESLNSVNHSDDFSFEKWLIEAIGQNLIYHFKEN
jgi:hypothetical protein